MWRPVKAPQGHESTNVGAGTGGLKGPLWALSGKVFVRTPLAATKLTNVIR